MTQAMNTTIVIFGASGDLTERKLIPALYNAYCKGRMPENFNIVGVSRSEFSHDAFRDHLWEGVQEHASTICDEAEWQKFSQNIWYHAGNAKEQDVLHTLDAFLKEKENGTSNRLYYLSTAPSLYEPIVLNLGMANMVSEDGGWRRAIVEKPFGYDLKSAHALNDTIHRVFQEHQVYRIDHYLGKETAQNILLFRFANTIFEPLWNQNYVDNVQITVTESVDVGHRGDYYDKSGVLRDMFQNHLLQLLALVAMEPPVSMKADDVRDEKEKLLRSLRPVEPHETVRAQYEGYTETEGVEPDSQTPTYAALKMYVDNWRWFGVPFYLRSGKALANKTSEVIIQFKRPPCHLFGLPVDAQEIRPNVLAMCIQPNEGIHLRFETKVPDVIDQTRSVEMDFKYTTYFGDEPLPDAYERLLLDAMKGDATLFTRSDSIESSWRVIDHILEGWQSPDAPPLVSYARGSWGPVEADILVGKDGRRWRLECGKKHG